MREWLIQHRKALTVVFAFIALIIFSWSLFAAKLGQALQDYLVERYSQDVNGRIQVGTVDLSLYGGTQIKDVSLYSKQGDLLARIPIIKMQYSWSDLLKDNFGISHIKTITAEDAEIWVQEENSHWNWENFIKEDQSKENKFQGKMQIVSAKIYGKVLSMSKTLDEASGTIDFHSYPNLGISFKGKIGQANMNIDGDWNNGQFALLTIKGKDLNLPEFRDAIPPIQGVSLEGGKATALTMTTERNPQGIVKWQTEGEFSGLKIVGKRSITDGQGQFSGNQDGIKLQKMSFKISEQQTSGQGTLTWPQGVVSIDADLAVPDFDLNAFISGLKVQRPVECQVKVTGPLSGPAISGSFNIPQATFSNMPIDRIVGKFQYTGTNMLLKDVYGSAYQGTVGAEGDILINDESYELDASGQGLDGSRLTDKDVQGPLSFNGHVSGKGETAVTVGTFMIRDGKAYGIPFLTMTGHFVRRGAVTEISNIVMETIGGTIYPEQLSKEVLERLNPLEKPTLNTDSIKNEAEKRIEDTIKKEEKKLVPDIFR
ncbi:MAG: hypothetical protein AB9883_08380 [Acidaminococcaceae bacterium]